MLDKDKVIAMAEDTVEHKKIVLENCLLVSRYLIRNGEIQLGMELLKRGALHDNSKFESVEFENLAKILKSRKCFTDAKSKLSKEETTAIEYHWSHNRHHPEYYNKPSQEMEKLDIIEMVCDWYARSKQYGTDFIEFVKERQNNRFHFEDEVFNTILTYCELIKRLDAERANRSL